MQATAKTLKLPGPSRAGRRPRRSRTELHASIIHVASELFAARGFAEPTIREIAEGADVALPTLYRLFEDKKDIYVRCCKLAARRHADSFLQDHDTAESGEILLFRLLTQRVRSYQERTVEYRLVYRIYIDGDQAIISEEMDRLTKSDFFNKIKDVFERGAPGNLAEMRIAILDRFFQQLPVVLTIWPKFLDESRPEGFVQNCLTILLPDIDWDIVADQAKAPGIDEVLDSGGEMSCTEPSAMVQVAPST